MRKTFKRIVATVLAAVTIGAPSVARADMGEYCSTYKQVASKATGGDYVGGILVYETKGSVTREGPTEATTTTTSTTVSAGAPGVAGAAVTTTVTTTTSVREAITTTDEPIGFYAMNDGSMYQIDCITGESRKIT